MSLITRFNLVSLKEFRQLDYMIRSLSTQLFYCILMLHVIGRFHLANRALENVLKILLQCSVKK